MRVGPAVAAAEVCAGLGVADQVARGALAVTEAAGLRIAETGRVAITVGPVPILCCCSRGPTVEEIAAGMGGGRIAAGDAALAFAMRPL